MPPGLTFWFDYEGAKIHQIAGSSAYTSLSSHVAIDADGSPRAYHPADTGLDHLANAGYPNKGWRSVLVEDPAKPGTAYVQPTGPNKGYFVCKTTLADETMPVTDPRKYVNSEEMPYIVFPSTFYAIKGTGDWGDLAMVRRPGTAFESFAVVADKAPAARPWARCRSNWRRRWAATTRTHGTGQAHRRGRSNTSSFPAQDRPRPGPATAATCSNKPALFSPRSAAGRRYSPPCPRAHL